MVERVTECGERFDLRHQRSNERLLITEQSTPNRTPLPARCKQDAQASELTSNPYKHDAPASELIEALASRARREPDVIHSLAFWARGSFTRLRF